MEAPRHSSAEEVANARELHERIGYARCQLDAARDDLDALLRSRQDLERQVQVVRSEIEALRRELAERLADWCSLDELDQRHEHAAAFLNRVESVRSSATYRITAALLAAINRARAVATLRWLRRGGHG